MKLKMKYRIINLAFEIKNCFTIPLLETLKQNILLVESYKE